MKPLAQRILDEFQPSLPERIKDLESTVVKTSEYATLVSIREDIITLLKDNPKNVRLSKLLKKINRKIRRLK